MGSVGGLSRTYGLHRHFERDEQTGRGGRKLSRSQFRRMGGYFRPYFRQWLVILGCIASTAGLRVLPPLVVAVIIDSAIPNHDGSLLTLLVGAMVGLALVAELIAVLQQTLTARVGQGIIFDLRNQLFAHLQRMSLRFYTSTRSGEIVSRVNNDVEAVRGVTTHTIVNIANNVATLAATATAMLSRDWRLTLLAVAIVPVFYIPSRLVGGIRRRLSVQTQQSYASLLPFLNERMHVGGLILMNIFGQRTSDAGEFSRQSATVRDLHVKQAVVGRWLFMILAVFSTIGPALVYWYGGFKAMTGELSTGDLIAFAALLTLLYRPMVQLATVYVDIQASVGVFDRIFEYLDMSPDVADTPVAQPIDGTRGHICFEDVSFSYPLPPATLVPRGAASRPGRPGLDGEALDGEADEAPAKPFAISDVSFEIRPGQRVALVGPSGAGKTTITYLVPRFYDPDSGRVTLDGRDLREIGQESLRSHIGMVTQETFLFHATIRENLHYARPGASQGEIEEACQAANVHEFIDSLPEKYDTVVGERGFRLSGGEKQRLSIARALLKDPAILILDEATSSLDATSEHLIQTALETLLEGRTSLIIAHRLSTILNSDLIVVMDRGRIVQSGRHEELLQWGGLYARLFNQQFGRVLGMERT